MGTKQTTENEALYKKDFYEWTAQTADLIRQHQYRLIDSHVLAEEIEDMGRRDYRDVKSHMINLLAHLLKWEFQPEKRSKSWEITISRDRRDLSLLFEDSTSLYNKAHNDLDGIYQKAVWSASDETSLPTGRFPASCPYNFQLILRRDFWPGPEDYSSEVETS